MPLASTCYLTPSAAHPKTSNRTAILHKHAYSSHSFEDESLVTLAISLVILILDVITFKEAPVQIQRS